MSGAGPDGVGGGSAWPPGQRTALCLCIDVSEPVLTEGPPPLVPEPWYERSGADRLLRLLADVDVAATLTWSRPSAISAQLVAEAHAAGHEVAARLRDDFLPASEWEDELRRTLAALGEMARAPVTGVKATGTNQRGQLYELIRALGLRWVIDQAYGDVPLVLGAEQEGPPLVHLPTSRWYDDRIAVREGGRDAAAVFSLWRDDLDVVRTEGGVMVLSLHPSLIGRPGLSRALAQLLDIAIEAGDIWITSAGAIAGWWRQQHQPASEGTGS